MRESQFSREGYQREALVSRWLPTVTGLLFIGLFLAALFLGENFLILVLIAIIPSVFLLWRWILAERQIEQWGCPSCRQPFPKKTYWTYPPRVCPRCGKSVSG